MRMLAQAGPSVRAILLSGALCLTAPGALAALAETNRGVQYVPEVRQAFLPPVSAVGSSTTNWPPFGVVPDQLTVFGKQATMRFGTALAVVRDARRDGRTVIAVGMPRCEYGRPRVTDAGAVAFFALATNATSFTALGLLPSPAPLAVLGQSMEAVGDVDGDGFRDLLIGAPNYRVSYSLEGAWILNTDPAPWSSAAQRQLVVPSGLGGSRLGVSVARAGDINGDGHEDIIVGAPRQRTGARSGTVFVYHGTNHGMQTEPAWMAHGKSAMELFGRSVAGAGDVNGDGYDDVLVGAPRFSERGEDAGRAYLFLGSPKGLQRTAAWITEGTTPMGWMGETLASLGDVNDDGFDDVAIGAPGWDQNVAAWPGALFLFLGSTNGLAATPSMKWQGSSFGARFGAAVAAGGDFNGDRFPDLLVGAPKTSETNASAGRVFLFLGRTGGFSASPSWVLDGSQPGDFCGAALLTVPDQNGDGCDEFLVGSPRSSAMGRREGRVDLLLGSRTGYDSTNQVAAPAWAENVAASGPARSPRLPMFVWYGATGGVVAILTAGVLFRRRRQPAFVAEEAVESERRRIARDLHDDLGARLARISFLTELVNRDASATEEGRKNAEILAATTREVLGAMEQILWSVNPANDTLENLVTFIIQYSGPFFAPTGIQCRHESPLQLPARIIRPAVRKNVFLTVKEALNNVAKHSGATEAVIRIQLADARLTIVIEDNGRGCGTDGGTSSPGKSMVDATAAPARSAMRRGQGLKNMRFRMQEVAGEFVLEQPAEGGTRVTIAVKV